MTTEKTGSLKEIHFVTGKGGVGKSTAALLLALKFANSGKKTLLAEIGDRSFFSHFLTKPIHYQPLEVSSNLEIAHWSAEECLKSYALSLLKVEALYRLFFENPVTRSLIQVAPSLAELAVTGQITSSPRNHGPHGQHEILVIDAYASGHFLNLICAPEAMGETIQLGPMGQQSREIHKVFQSSGICRLHIVSTPEELPISEALELYADIKKTFDWPTEFILNRYLNTNLDFNKIKESSLMQKAIRDKLMAQSQSLKTLNQSGLSTRTIPLISSLKSMSDLKQLQFGELK